MIIERQDLHNATRTAEQIIETGCAATEPPVLITLAEVKLSTAAALGLPRAKTAWWRAASRTVVASLRWAVVEGAPAPKKRYPPRTPSYYEAGLMDREMRRL